MKRRNLSLRVGTLVCLAVLALVLFPQHLTRKSPYTTQVMRSWTEEATLHFERAPFAPSAGFVFGSDDHGRDVWSLIVYGARLTMVLGALTVLGRFAIALPLALTAGFGSRFARSIIKQFGLLFSAIPALLIAIVVLKQDFFTSLDKSQSVVAFVVVLSLVGWGKLGVLIMERTEAIMRQPYIRSEVAVGKRRIAIALENVVPHLASEIVVLLFMEVARALALIMQLGIFGVFVGSLRIIRGTDEGIVSAFNTSFEPEWASMLGTAGSMAFSAPWTVLLPATAFFVSVLGFNLLGEGLRARIQDADSRFTPALRTVLRLDFRALVGSLTPARLTRAAVALVLAVGLLIVPSALDASRYRFGLPTDGPSGTAGQVLIGSPEARATADSIAARMRSLGIEPVADDGYFIDYPVEPATVARAHTVTITDATGALSPIMGRDYSFVSVGDLDLRGPVYDARRSDLLAMSDYTDMNRRFVLVDTKHYSDDSVAHIVESITREASVAGILLTARSNEELGGPMATEADRRFVLRISPALADAITAMTSPTLHVSARVERLGSRGRNVVGVLPGTDAGISDKAIFIGLGYNYTADCGPAALRFGVRLMERLSSAEGNRRSIIFAFLDGTPSDRHHGVHALVDSLPYNGSDIDVYLDLTGLRGESFDAAIYSSAQAPITRYYAWTFARLLEELLAERGLPLASLPARNRGGEYYFQRRSADNAMFWGNGVATVVLGSSPTADGRYRLEELGEIVLKAIAMNNY